MPSCAPVELQVSQLLRDAFMFRRVRVDDMEERKEFEWWLIATLAACLVLQSRFVDMTTPFLRAMVR